MKKVLFVAEYVYLGGGEIGLLNLIHALKKMDYHATLIIPKEGPLLYEAKNQSVDVRIVDMPLISKKLIGHPLKFLKTLFNIGKIIKEEGISYVFANTLNPGIYASLAAKAFGIKSIWYCWGWDFPKNKLWQRIYRILFDKIAFPSKYVKETMGLATFEQRNIPVLYPGIDVDLWAGDNAYIESQFKKENGIPMDHDIFSIIARITPWKNQLMFLDVANEIVKQHPKSYFLIAGDYNDRDGSDRCFKSELDKKIKSMLALKEKIMFTGFVKDIKRVIKASSIVFSCSGHYFDKGRGEKLLRGESFGFIIIEAMASGRPVVAISLGGPPEIIVDGFNGFLVKEGDYKTMAEKALEALNSHTKYNTIIDNAKKCVAEKYTLERLAKDVVNLWN